MAHSFHISQSKNTQVQINHYTCQTLNTKERKDCARNTYQQFRSRHHDWCLTKTSYKYNYRVPSEGTSKNASKSPLFGYKVTKKCKPVVMVSFTKKTTNDLTNIITEFCLKELKKMQTSHHGFVYKENYK